MGDYTVETKNRFQLALDDDEADVYEILKAAEQKPDKKKSEQPEPQKDKKNVKNTKGKSDKREKGKKPGQDQKTDNVNSTNIQNTNNKNFRGGSFGNDNRPPRMRQQKEFGSDNFEKPPSQEGFGGGRGPRRGGSAPYRGGRRGGNSGRRFERHSGSEKTGVKAVEKRDGSGPHNWGSEIDSQLDNSVVQEEGTPAEGGDKPEDAGEEGTIKASQDGGTEGEEAPEPESGPKEMTLDEWKAAQANARVKQQFNVRQAGEGEDPKQWKKGTLLERRRRAESSESYDDEDDDHEYHSKSADTRAALDKLNIQIRFSDGAASRGGGMRGGGRGGRGARGRGGPRGGRGRGGGGFSGQPSTRSGQKDASAPLVDNEAEFPSLGSK